jgi:hypothetical protein
MAKLTERVEALDAYSSVAEKIIQWAPPATGFLASALATGWAASVTNALRILAPFSWVMGALLGSLVFASAYALWAKAQLNVARYRMARAIESSDSAINPLEETFVKQKINLMDFRQIVPGEKVVSKTFSGCDLVGPATILLTNNSTLQHNQLTGCDFVMISDTARVQSVMVFEGTTISRCRVFGVTFLFAECVAKNLIANGELKGANWITNID